MSAFDITDLTIRRRNLVSHEQSQEVAEVGEETRRRERKHFWAFDKAALTDGAIPKEYVELMAVAVELTTQCVYCIEIPRKSALESIATEAELREAIHVVTALRAGAAITQGTRLLEP